MSFAERLLKKIRIDGLALAVSSTIGPPGSGKKIDRESMRGLLAMSNWSRRDERDLELYVKPLAKNRADILVLDNELPIFVNTTIKDVLIRKSPTTSEMVKHPIMILFYGKELVPTRRIESLEAIRRVCLNDIDLSFSEKDIEAMESDAVRALSQKDTAKVLEAITLFSELLGYQTIPKPAGSEDVVIKGLVRKNRDGVTVAGPAIVYRMTENKIFLGELPSDFSKAGGKALSDLAAAGNPEVKGEEVFRRLRCEVAALYGLSGGAVRDLKAGTKRPIL